MRILHCLHASPLERAAGVEVYTAALAQEQAASDEVALLYPAATASSPRRFVLDGVHHFEVPANPFPRSFEGTYFQSSVHRDLIEVLHVFRPEILHVQHLMGLSSELPAIAQSQNIPVVMTLHDYWLQCAAGGQRFHREKGLCNEITAEGCAECTAHLSGPAMVMRSWFAKMGIHTPAPTSIADEFEANDPRHASPRQPTRPYEAVRSLAARLTRVRQPVQEGRIRERWETLLQSSYEIDRFLAPSHFIRDELIQFGLAAGSIQHIELGMPAHHFAKKRPKPQRALHFGYLGGITRHKGLHRLIDAMNTLPSDARLTIWGSLDDDPDYADSLRNRVRHRGIQFAGAASPLDVPERLREFDCLIVPSLWYENAPLVIREAFAAGTPVVASQLGGHSELLASGGGLLYDPEQPGELAACMLRLMTEEGLLQHLVEKQPRTKTMRTHADEISGVYRTIISEVMGEINSDSTKD